MAKKPTWRDYCDPATWHPVANAFPPMAKDRLKELAANIETQGRVLVTLKLYRGQLLDGRNRVLALQMLAERDVHVAVDLESLGADTDPITESWSLNAERRDLTTSERAMAGARLLVMREEAEPTANLQSGDAAARMARALGVSPRLMYEALSILRSDPKLADKVKGKFTINRAKLELKEKSRAAAALARSRGIPGQTEAMPILGRAKDHIGELDPGSVQLLLVDPPYAVEYDPDEHGPMANDNPEDAPRLLREVLELMAPKLAATAHCYIFVPAQNDLIHNVARRFFRRRFDVGIERLIWLKDWTHAGNKEQGYARVYERIVHARLGTHTIGGIVHGMGDPARPLLGRPARYSRTGSPEPVRLPAVLPFPAPTRRIHMTQKPEELLWLLILQSTYEGEKVADPFAGSGSTLRAAREAGRKYWGTEIQPEYHEQAVVYVESSLVMPEWVELECDLLWRRRVLSGVRKLPDGSGEVVTKVNWLRPPLDRRWTDDEAGQLLRKVEGKEPTDEQVATVLDFVKNLDKRRVNISDENDEPEVDNPLTRGEIEDLRRRGHHRVVKRKTV